MRNFAPYLSKLALLIIAGSLLASTSLFVNAQVVRFSEVSEQVLQSRKRVIGTLKAFNQANIAASEPGIVTAALVNEGDLVKRGDVLIELDDRKLTAEHRRLTAEHALSYANYELAKAQFEQAEQDYLAYQQSATKNAISEQRLRQSKTAAITGQAKVIAAHQAIKALDAQLSAINVRIDDMKIKAPFDGQVTFRNAELGQWLDGGATALTLTSLDKLEAWLDVPERFAQLAKTTPKRIPLMVGNTLVEGENVKILNRVDERARTFKVISEVTDTTLMPGMSISAWLPEGDKTLMLTVPKDAIVQRGGNNLVYKIQQQGEEQIAQPVTVSIKFHQGDAVAIYAQQLTPGDKIITEGNERLMPGPVVAVPDQKIKAIANANETNSL